MAQPLKIGNGYEISSHTLLVMWFRIRAGILAGILILINGDPVHYEFDDIVIDMHVR